MKGATLKDVAKEALVSVASVSRVINGLDNVTDDIRSRVLSAASKLKYIPHAGARSLATSRSNTIGVLLPDIYGEFFSEIIRGIDQSARESGLHIMVSSSHGDLNETIGAIRSMAGRVDGMLVMLPFASPNSLRDILPNDFPIVAISSQLNDDSGGVISIDNCGGALKAVRHLYDVGCKRVAHISGPKTNFEANERENGFLKGLEACFNGQSPIIYEGDFTEEAGRAAVDEFMKNDILPDGIFAANDMMAVGALTRLQALGIKVPDDVAIIGFDDIPITRFTSPAISTIRVGMFEVGKRGLNYLSSLIEDEGFHSADKRSGIVFLPELIIRASTLKNRKT